MKKILLLSAFILLSIISRAQLVADFTWCPVYDTSAQMCCIQFENLSTDSPGVIVTYVYDYGDGVVGTVSDPQHCYVQLGTYIVTLIVADNFGNLDTVFHTLTITHLDTTGCNCDSLIGVNDFDILKASLEFIPNPFHNVAQVTIQYTASSSENNFRLRIYNVFGQLAREEFIHGLSFNLYRKSLNGGLYFYELISDNGRAGTGKFIIE